MREDTVLFLDIDGVVNCATTMQRHRGYIGIDPMMAFLVGKIVLDTDCKVVLSSSWRTFHDDGVQEISKQVTPVHDVTPPPWSGSNRGLEIKAWLDKTTDAILKKNPSLVAIENLSIPKMLKQRRLARPISEAAWGEFFRQIKYKTVWRGGQVVQIDRFYPSSRTCSECFYVADSLPLSVREWDCPQCETHHDRDENAAKVILHRGEVIARAEGLQSTRRNATLV